MQEFFSCSDFRETLDCWQYAQGFTKEEVAQVQDFLTSNGYGRFEVERIGCGGDFVGLSDDTVGVEALVLPGQTPLHIAFFCYR